MKLAQLLCGEGRTEVGVVLAIESQNGAFEGEVGVVVVFIGGNDFTSPNLIGGGVIILDGSNNLVAGNLIGARPAR
mgnify:CR=1 FL=1